MGAQVGLAGVGTALIPHGVLGLGHMSELPECRLLWHLWMPPWP